MNQPKATAVKRIGIIGCGLIADTHIEAILDAVPGAEIVVTDPMPGKAELLRRKYQLRKSYTELDEMLTAERPESVHILSPPQWHIPHAHRCIECGCHVLIEKPLCFSVEEAEQLYEAAHKAGVRITVDHSLLLQPSVLRMRRRLQEQSTTRVLQIDSFYGVDANEAGAGGLPADHWKHGIPGGALMDTLVHPLSLAVSLTGSPRNLVLSSVEQPGADQVKVIWKTEKALVSIAVSQAAQPFRRMTQVITSDMTCMVDHSSEVLVVLGKGFGPRALKKLLTNFSLAAQLALGTIQTVWHVARKRLKQNPGARALIAAYYDHLAGRGENPTPQAAVLDTTRALQEVARSVGERKPESPQQPPVAAGNGAPTSQPPKKILVTGASGFLGRTLCRGLVREEHLHVIAQVRRSANADRLPASPRLQRQFVDFDHFKPSDFDRLLQGVEDVVHCAHAAGAKVWEDYERRNVGHSLELYEASARNGCKRFIHISSLAVYGVRSRREKQLDETMPIRNGDSRWNFYIRSKSLAERALLDRAAKGGPKLLILRPGILYSAAGERLLSKSIPTRDGRLFIFIGSGRNLLPYTRVDAVAATIVRALKADPFPEGVFNLSGQQNECFKKFLERRCERLGVHCRFVHLPAFCLRLGGWFLETLYSASFRRRPPKLTRYIVDSATRSLVYDCRKAEERLGWDPAQAVAM